MAVATDYDGTIALHGQVDEATCAAMATVRKSGRKLILVTGRDLPDLQRVFPALNLFDLIVAENGALLFDPVTKEEIPLAEPPPQALVDRLRSDNVSPLTVGRSIIATWEPNEQIVLKAIRDLALDQHIIFNKGAVMVLPSGINKASGLKSAVKRLGLSAPNVVGIGDAENDLAFLEACGCAVAVGNALPTVKSKCDLVVNDHGKGFADLSAMLIHDDLAAALAKQPKHNLAIGHNAEGDVALSRFDTVLVTGSSGGGKSTIVTALLEQLQAHGYQFCVVDPEGDYGSLDNAVVVGGPKQVPHITESINLLGNPETNVVINLLAVDPHERPGFLSRFLPRLAEFRSQTGRPHWIVLDEAHHCLPAKWDPAPVTLPTKLPAVIAVTVHAEEVAPAFLSLVTKVVSVGSGAIAAIERFCKATGKPFPAAAQPAPEVGEIFLFDEHGGLQRLIARQPRGKKNRHIRKYAEGELGEDKSFYFRGPDNALNLRAHNLIVFLQLAVGVDDKTWLYHLREGAYSRWFRDAIKDSELAAEAEVVERDTGLSPRESREAIKAIVDKKYTAPSKSGSSAA